MLGEGMIVADLGAGSGAYTFAAAYGVGRTGRVYAVDVQRDLVSRIANLARTNGLHNIEVIWGDVERFCGTKFSDESLDAVVAGNLLFQVEDRPAVVAEVYRILRPGGKALIVDWLASFDGAGPHPDHVFLYGVARRMCESEGLVCHETIQAGEHHWGMICRKRPAYST